MDKPRYYTAWGPDGRSVVRCRFPVNPDRLLTGMDFDEGCEWTPEQDAVLLAMKAQRRSTRSISIAVGHPYYGVRDRLKRLNKQSREAAE